MFRKMGANEEAWENILFNLQNIVDIVEEVDEAFAQLETIDLTGLTAKKEKTALAETPDVEKPEDKTLKQPAPPGYRTKDDGTLEESPVFSGDLSEHGAIKQADLGRTYRKGDERAVAKKLEEARDVILEQERIYADTPEYEAVFQDAYSGIDAILTRLQNAGVMEPKDIDAAVQDVYGEIAQEFVTLINALEGGEAREMWRPVQDALNEVVSVLPRRTQEPGGLFPSSQEATEAKKVTAMEPDEAGDREWRAGKTFELTSDETSHIMRPGGSQYGDWPGSSLSGADIMLEFDAAGDLVDFEGPEDAESAEIDAFVGRLREKETNEATMAKKKTAGTDYTGWYQIEFTNLYAMKTWSSRPGFVADFPRLVRKAAASQNIKIEGSDEQRHWTAYTQHEHVAEAFAQVLNDLWVPESRIRVSMYEKTGEIEAVLEPDVGSLNITLASEVYDLDQLDDAAIDLAERIHRQMGGVRIEGPNSMGGKGETVVSMSVIFEEGDATNIDAMADQIEQILGKLDISAEYQPLVETLATMQKKTAQDDSADQMVLNADMINDIFEQEAANRGVPGDIYEGARGFIEKYNDKSSLWWSKAKDVLNYANEEDKVEAIEMVAEEIPGVKVARCKIAQAVDEGDMPIDMNKLWMGVSDIGANVIDVSLDFKETNAMKKLQLESRKKIAQDTVSEAYPGAVVESADEEDLIIRLPDGSTELWGAVGEGGSASYTLVHEGLEYEFVSSSPSHYPQLAPLTNPLEAALDGESSNTPGMATAFTSLAMDGEMEEAMNELDEEFEETEDAEMMGAADLDTEVAEEIVEEVTDKVEDALADLFKLDDDVAEEPNKGKESESSSDEEMDYDEEAYSEESMDYTEGMKVYVKSMKREGTVIDSNGPRHVLVHVGGSPVVLAASVLHPV